MKKLFLLTITAGLAISSFAQSSHYAMQAKAGDAPFVPGRTENVANKTTTVIIHDSLVMANVTTTDTAYSYFISYGGSFDSGYYTGMNFLGWNAYAERYDFNPHDSTVKVIGVLPVFGGYVNPASTNKVTLKVWTQGAASVASSHAAYNGLPGTLLDSVNVFDTSLHVTATSYGEVPFYFATPTAYLTDSFFVGYSMNYTWGSTNGDTVCVPCTRNGVRMSAPYTFPIAGDTLINDQNAFMQGGVWGDYAYDLGFVTDLFIFPIVDTKDSTTGVSITNKNFTFSGNYPNPAISNMNVKFSLANATDISLEVMDINGRIINTIKQSNLSAGDHIINIETAEMAAGDYVYLIRTTNGNGIASKFTVIK